MKKAPGRDHHPHAIGHQNVSFLHTAKMIHYTVIATLQYPNENVY